MLRLRSLFRPCHLVIAALIALAALLASGGYYLQAIKGHARIMLAATSIEDIVGRPDTDDELRPRLHLVQDIRNYASIELALPDNASYRRYAEVGRDQLAWNLIALPEFSLQPKQWCYPIVGCQSYRGYFDRDRAQRLADELAAEGYEVVIRGVGAYSTLGLTADPVTDIMLQRNDLALAELIFHELAHQRVFVRGDTMFNESYATFVGEQGLRQWLQGQEREQELARWQAHRDRVQLFNELLRGVRDELRILYASELPEAEMRQRKQEILGGVRVAFDRQLLAANPEMMRLESWFDRPVTNARLASIAVYRHWVPAFEALFHEVDGDWEAFHARVEALAGLPGQQRSARVDALLPGAGEGPTI